LWSQLIERFAGRLPGYIGYGNDKFSFCHVDDLVDGHIAAMDKGRQGERYLLTGENASFKLVFDMAAIISETKKPRFSIPLCIIESYGWLLVLVSRLTGNLPLISPPVCPIALTTQFWSCYSFGVFFFIYRVGYRDNSFDIWLYTIFLRADCTCSKTSVGIFMWKGQDRARL